tara:strand:+ start:789 stop:1409 length:621 start_codon:yes stop_codon:yes gene_type:complete
MRVTVILYNGDDETECEINWALAYQKANTVKDSHIVKIFPLPPNGPTPPILGLTYLLEEQDDAIDTLIISAHGAADKFDIASGDPSSDSFGVVGGDYSNVTPYEFGHKIGPYMKNNGVLWLLTCNTMDNDNNHTGYISQSIADKAECTVYAFSGALRVDGDNETASYSTFVSPDHMLYESTSTSTTAHFFANYHNEYPEMHFHSDL